MRAAAIATALAVALALTGCSAPTISGGTGGGGGSGGGTSGDGSDPAVGTGSGSGSGDDTGAGNGGTPITGRLPADWPADVVVPEGEIVQSASLGEAGWLALIDVEDPNAGFTESTSAIKIAGYSVVSEVITDHGSVGIYENDQLQVQIAVTADTGTGWNMSFTVTKN